jgi:gluconolactonase
MSVDIRDPRFVDIVGEEVQLEELGSGFDFTEGPIWNPREKHLIFSDMPGDHMRRWSERDGITTFRRPSNMANGNTYDSLGRILTCEHATSRVTRTELDGSITVLATEWQGKQLNSPNDIVVAPDGSIYFTDPSFGRMEYYGVKREEELGFRGVYRLIADAPGGHQLQLLVDDFDQPNGLIFSLDGRTLLVNDTMRAHIRAFDVQPDGSLTNSRVWADVKGEGEGAADGMKFDSAGNLYCTGPGGLHVFDSEGTLLGVIKAPQSVANFAFGDEDLRGIFMTASTSLYRVRVKVPGLPLF